MLSFLFALASIWTLFWFVMLVLDWGERTSFSDSNALCPTCAKPTKSGSAPANPAVSPANTNHTNNTVSECLVAKPAAANNDSSNAATSASSASIEKKPVADKHDQANVTPLFEKPAESDDLKIIKGIGVVMEQTLNDLGITTFKQLAGFKQAEVKMVSDVLSEANAGFGDRIERDEWVDQARKLAK